MKLYCKFCGEQITMHQTIIEHCYGEHNELMEIYYEMDCD